MKLAPGSVINLTATSPDWVIAFDCGDDTVPEVVCPIIGWATVVETHMTDGTTTTCVQPAFLHQDTVWTPNELLEHAPEARGFEIRAREIVHA